MISLDSALFLAGMVVVLAAVATIQELSAGKVAYRKIVWSSTAVLLPLFGASLALLFGPLDPGIDAAIGAIASAPFGVACCITAAYRREPAPGPLKFAGILINGGVLMPLLCGMVYLAFLFRDGCC
jgi:hypothetical protein